MKHLPSGLEADWDSFKRLRQQIDHLFDSVATPSSSGDFAKTFLLRDVQWAPTIDVSETDKEFKVIAELPGIDEKNIFVEIRDHDLLTISGEKTVTRNEKEENYYLKERASGFFTRSIQIPPYIDKNNIKATFDKNVLTLILPKIAEAYNNVVKIDITKAPA